jgi:hypothetical protein
MGRPVGMLIPPTMDDTIDETLGSLTAVGVAEIWDSNEETMG